MIAANTALVVLFTPRDVYGRQLFYPVCARAELVCRLAGRKALQATHLKLLETIGLDVRIRLTEVLL